MRSSPEPTQAAVPSNSPNGTKDRGRWSLKEAANELGVSYWTARRIFIAENVGRYSTGIGTSPVYPSTPLKRFQRVRMTYVITDSDIERVQKKMRGEAC